MTLLLLDFIVVGVPQLQLQHAIALRDYQPATRSCRDQQATRSNFGSTSSSSPPLIYLLLRVHGTGTHMNVYSRIRGMVGDYSHICWNFIEFHMKLKSSEGSKTMRCDGRVGNRKKWF
ncbi:hypothetical protein C4D60_Mb01t08130 [Musa balbisiana]|uniref:Secreted protein n=1 Tax=Musa balbisiana TaxID=52838 RepID=A0A4S8JKP3_MUSBA|nr:hypothetical protein C4D60_Mb01t08130 [Musa balbisiana]